MTELIGLIAIYVWVHAAIIIIRDKKKSNYENGVLIAALVAFVLLAVGTVM